jgi:hypothetical protein
MELNSKHLRAEQMRQQRERFETESAFRSRGFGGSSHIPRNPGRANFFDEDDDDDKFFFGATVRSKLTPCFCGVSFAR